MVTLGHVKTRIAALAVALTTLLSAGAGAQSAQEILRDVRMSQEGTNLSLNGEFRHGRTKMPLQLDIQGESVRYTIGDRSFSVKLGDTSAAPEGRIAGSDLTMEDASLRFLYWPNATIEGEDTVMTKRAWRLKVSPGKTPSQYAFVRLWVEKERGALLRAEGYDAKGNAIRRFEVRSVQRYGKGWGLKSMRVQTVAEGRDKTPTYIEVRPPAG